MHTRFVKTARLALATFILASLAACSSDLGSAKIKQIPKDGTVEQVIAELGDGPLKAQLPADSVRLVGGFRRETYIAGGGKVDVIWYREEPGTLEDVIDKTTETPVVLKDGKFQGGGWSYYEEFASKAGIPNAIRGRERLDSISKAQSAGK
ncbi:hypothetical protein [Gemmatimonas sp.]|uniref:hypothetical protein n=1 Tax=Gemmatimonas sp. TaxID=1962908 RepID=UPI0039839D2C